MKNPGRPLHFQTLTADLNSENLTASTGGVILSITAKNYPTLPYSIHKVKLNKEAIPLKVKNVASYLKSCRFSREPSLPTPDNRIMEYFRSVLRTQSPAEFLNLQTITHIMEAFPESTSVDTYEDGYIAISYASLNALRQVIYDHGDMIRVDRFHIVFEENAWRSSCNWKVGDPVIFTFPSSTSALFVESC